MPFDVLEASFLCAGAHVSDLPAPSLPEVAFAGRSNVGKSSLINALVARRKLVRTSNTPGCTRTINLFRAKVRTAAPEPASLDLVDLPGYGFAKRSKGERAGWGKQIEMFLKEREGLRAVVVIVDVRRGIEEDDGQLLEFIDFVGRAPIVVATKLDKLPTSKRKPIVQDLVRLAAPTPVIGFSAETSDGRDALWRAIFRACELDAAAVAPAA